MRPLWRWKRSSVSRRLAASGASYGSRPLDLTVRIEKALRSFIPSLQSLNLSYQSASYSLSLSLSLSYTHPRPVTRLRTTHHAAQQRLDPSARVRHRRDGLRKDGKGWNDRKEL